jgi:hypothetical protein
VINKKIGKKALNYILYFNYGPDILGVIANLKPAVRCVIKENEINSFILLCQKYNLEYSFSDCRYDILQNQVIVKSMSSNILKMYISKSTKLCDELKYYDEKDDKITGRLLGYPDCCVNFYLDLTKNKNRQNIDFVLESYIKTQKKFDFRINNLREWCGGLQIDYSLIDFFPCSYGCKEAVKYANNLFEYIKKIDKKQASNIKKQLTKPIIYYDNKNAKPISKSIQKRKDKVKILRFS